jgi:predicted ATPase
MQLHFFLFTGLREFNQNQSIIISGESGAGKTEATKQVRDATKDTWWREAKEGACD